MHMNFWTLGLKNAWRDWRAGELRLLVVAVSLAVASLTAVGFFADRLQGGLERDARQLLGGDAVATVKAGLRAVNGVTTGPIIVNSSRAILYATSGKDFADQARAVALQTREVLSAARH